MNTDLHDPEPSVVLQHLAGKYMTFKVDNQVYGLGIMRVREIIRPLDITRIPRVPEFLRGVINLRGKVIPVIDLRMTFGMPAIELGSESVIIVVQYRCGNQDTTAGILVDEVVEVLDIAASNIEPPPTYAGESLDADFILGIGKHNDIVLFLLDVSRVLVGEEQLLAGLSKTDETTLSPQTNQR